MSMIFKIVAHRALPVARPRRLNVYRTVCICSNFKHTHTHTLSALLHRTSGLRSDFRELNMTLIHQLLLRFIRVYLRLYRFLLCEDKKCRTDERRLHMSIQHLASFYRHCRRLRYLPSLTQHHFSFFRPDLTGRGPHSTAVVLLRIDSGLYWDYPRQSDQ